jgi:hypothetical protein
MAATKKQGQWFGLFLVGLTTACAGLASFSGSIGKVALLLGILILAASLWSFLKLKPLEGEVALGSQPAGMKLLGVLLTLLGWVVVLVGLHLTPSIGGKLVIAVIGLVISLVGVIGILPAACNKDAIWKA